MRDKDWLDPAERLSDDTIKRAEEMCRGLSSSLSIDKRGEASFYNGAVKVLDTTAQREYLVTVCEVSGQPWYTLIGDECLPASADALLVFKSPLMEDSRYLGKLQQARPGLRADDQAGRYFAIYEPREDVRQR